MVTAAVPTAPAGIAVPAVMLNTPGLPATGVAPGAPKQANALTEIGCAGEEPLPVFV